MTRAEVEARWIGLIDGRLAPEVVRAWADPWVRETDHEPSEAGVDDAIYILHGLTGPHRWAEIQSSDTLAESLSAWRARCAEHYVDPIAFTRRRGLDFLRGLAIAYPDKVEAIAALLVERGQLAESDVRGVLEDRRAGEDE